MSNKKDCDIIKDLLPNYIENLISDNTRLYIENHISDCDQCKEIYMSLKDDKLYQEDINDTIEFNYLKKYRNKMIIIKSILFGLIFILLITLIIVVIRYKYNGFIIDTSYKKHQQLRDLENYTISVEEIEIDYKTQEKIKSSNKYYYRNGTYKTESDLGIGTNSENIFSYYGEVNSNKRITIWENTKTIEYSNSNFVFVKKGDFFDVYTEINLYGGNFIIKNTVSIKTKRYNGKECYVIKFQGNKDGYRETWIDKESMLTVRVIEEQYNNYYRETIFTLTENNVSDDILSLPELEGYTEKNSEIVANEDMKKYYTLVEHD